MAGTYTAAGKTVMLNALKAVVTRLGLLTSASAEPGGTYEKKEVTWGTYSEGEIAASNQPVFDIPESTTIRYVTYNSTDGNTEYAREQVTDETFTSAGTYTVTSAKIKLTDPA